MLSLTRLIARTRAAPRVGWKLVRAGRPRRLVLFGPVSLGDDLMCSALLREWRKRDTGEQWMMTRHPSLFDGNPDVDRVIPIDEYHAQALALVGTAVIRPYYVSLKPDDGDAPPPRSHFIRQMCELAGLRGEVALRPYLHLTPAEREQGCLESSQIVIHSTGRTAQFANANKEWSPRRFQEVVDQLRARFGFVQVGARDDPPLAGARDLRGLTSVRETAAIVAASLAVVCQEGFLMHLARAVNVRAVVVYGGALEPVITGYVANANLYSPEPCAPCWRRNRCEHDRICMTNIRPAHVIAALDQVVQKAGQPLELETTVL